MSEKSEDHVLNGENDDVPSSSPEEVGTTTTFETFVNLCNTVLGAGIITNSSTFKGVGIIVGTLLMVLNVWLSNFSALIMLQLGKALKVDSLEYLADKVLGKAGKFATGIPLTIFCVVCTVGYLIIGTDIIVSWLVLAGVSELTLSGYGWRFLITTLYLVIIPGPMTYLRSLSCLAKLSLPTTSSLFLYFFATIGQCIYTAIKKDRTFPDSSCYADVTSGGTSVFLAFGVHSLTFALQTCLLAPVAPYDPSLKKRTIVTGYTYIFAFTLTIIPGLLGYFYFGNNLVNDQLPNNFGDSPLWIIVNIGIFLKVSTSYPGVSVTTFASLSKMIFNDDIINRLPDMKRIILVTIVNVINLIISVFLKDSVKPILGIGGSLGACVLSFILPSICVLLITTRAYTHWTNILHVLFIVFGVFATIACTYSSVEGVIASFS